jgi:UDPglucose 6-dehydrogenase
VTAGLTGFLGLSHLGIVSSIGWASLGSRVIGVDLERDPVERLGRGELSVHEPGLPETFAAARERMRFTTDPAALAECALVIVSRDVPTDADNGSDTSAVLRLVDAAIPHLRPGAVLAVMSQVPPGFTRALAARIEARRPGLGLRVHYWVETLIFGNAVRRFLEPERIIVGAADPARPLPAELADGLARFGCPVLPMRYESAELTKTAINLYLFGAVTYANTLADLCEEVGADWSEMAPALRLDKRIGPSAYIRPSLGVAGGNLERDLVTLRALCDAHGVDASYIDTLIRYNAARYRWVHRQLERRVLAATARPVIAVWGLAYKKDTRSTKNSMALRVIDDLLGRAEIQAYDPLVRASEIDVPAAVLANREATLAGADCLLILTDWDEFAATPRDAFKAMRRPLVIDCVGVVDPRRTDLDGVDYVTIGKPAGDKRAGEESARRGSTAP